MQLSGISDWLAQIQTAARAVGQWVGGAVDSRLAEWRATVKRFNDAYAKVQMSEGSNPALASKRNALLAAGQSLKEKIGWIENSIASLTQYVTTSGLGFLPAVVPATIVAAIIAATALIYKFMDEVSAYLAEERIVAQTVASGGDPVKARQQAQAAASQGGGLFGDVSGALVPLALIGAAAYILRGKI